MLEELAEYLYGEIARNQKQLEDLRCKYPMSESALNDDDCLQARMIESVISDLKEDLRHLEASS